MFSFEKQANAFKKVDKNHSDAFVLRLALNEKTDEISLFAPDNFNQLYPLNNE